LTGDGQEGRGLTWILIYGTDKVEGGLMVLFFGLVFFRPPSLKNFLPTRLRIYCVSCYKKRETISTMLWAQCQSFLPHDLVQTF